MSINNHWKDKAKTATVPIDPKILTKIRRSFDPNKLAKRCRQSIDEIFASTDGTIYQTIETNKKEGQRFCFKDNGSNILAVAHTDVVKDMPHFRDMKISDELLYFNTKFDDRLGVYTILDLLPLLGINVDWLLTEDEECANSSALHFDGEEHAKKQYNWIVEFDRRGEDAVIYDYDDFKPIVEKYFFLGFGSFSDISVMEHIGACAVNVGVGYHNEHTAKCYMEIGQYFRNIARFINMFNAEKDTYYKHSPYKYSSRWSLNSSGYSVFQDDWESDKYGGRQNYVEHPIITPEEASKLYQSHKKSEQIFDFTCMTCPECGTYFRETFIDFKDESCYCAVCDILYCFDDLFEIAGEDEESINDKDWLEKVSEDDPKDSVIEEELDLNIVDTATPFGKRFRGYNNMGTDDEFDPRYIDGRSVSSGWDEVVESYNHPFNNIRVPNGLFD